MNSYVDKHSLYHDKKVKYGTSSSNNGFTYSAYAKELGFKLNYFKIQDCYSMCKETARDDELYFIYRLPDKETPPISRDEIISMISLGLKPLEYGWFMYRNTKKESLSMYITAIIELWKIRRKHRNYFWLNKKVECYPIAMKLGWADRYYVDYMANKPTNLFYLCMFNLYALATILQNNISAKNVLFLQLEDMGSWWWIKFMDKRMQYMHYFEDNHPFNKYFRGEK